MKYVFLTFLITIAWSLIGVYACINIGSVQNLARNGTKVTWDAPANTSNCFLLYRVTHEYNLTVEQYVLVEKQFTFKPANCVTSKISVTAIANNTVSEITSVITFRTADLPAPTSVGVIPSRTSVESYWKTVPISQLPCRITSATVLLSNAIGSSLQNVTFPVQDNESRLFKLPVFNLNPGTRYNLRAVLYTEGIPSKTSAVTPFTTLP